MVYAKRLIIAVILGILAGLACAFLSKPSLMASLAPAMVPATMCHIALNRTLIGFIIGVSAWRMHWAIHGIVIGFIGSLAITAPMVGEPGQVGGFVIMMVAGMVWGFLIELITTVVFKAPMRTIEPVKAAPPPQSPPPPPPA
jgi:Na+/proline symporter